VGIEKMCIRLSFDGIPLKKDKTFNEQNIKPNSKIIVVFQAGPGG
jgi:cytochrome c oxidase assembly protein Cox11